jgi:hypothetical protein
MENQATLELNQNKIDNPKIEKVEKKKKETSNKIKDNQKNIIPKIQKVSILKKYGYKAFGAGLLICVALKPSIVENIFLSFDFSKRKKDRTETRNIKFPREVSEIYI